MLNWFKKLISGKNEPLVIIEPVKVQAPKPANVNVEAKTSSANAPKKKGRPSKKKTS
jgi:hypothetical protein